MATEIQSIMFPKEHFSTKLLVDEYLTKNRYPKKPIKTITEPPAFVYEN